jgi:hypothetical protein
MSAKPTLYILVSRQQIGAHGVALSLQKACESRGLPHEYLVAEDMSLDEIADMTFAPGSLLYRVSTQVKAATIESMLVLLHPGVFTTIYWPKTVPLTSRSFRELCEQMSAGLPIIPTRIIDETWQRLDEEKLTAKIASLGGFPVIIKTLGLSHGQGVQRVENVQALRELLAHAPFAGDEMIARKYLDRNRHFRLIVVDDAVVAAIEYHQPADDFRTNAGNEVQVSAIDVAELPKPIIETALAGVRLRASILGGVDILVDQTDGTAYLAEVNVPCYFARAEGPTGIDIASQIIDALLRKRDTA